MPRHLYLEHDGKVLLVDENGNGPQEAVMGREGPVIYRLPSEAEVEALGIDWKVRRTNRFRLAGTEHEVVCGLPEIEWPEHWTWKDKLPSDGAVCPVARESVYRSMHRCVSKVVLSDPGGRVALAKVKRGFFTGHWTLSGGFLDYAEHPREGVIREVKEEFGIDILLPDPHGEIGEITRPEEDLLFVSERIFTSEGIDFVSFTYHCQIPADTVFDCKFDEISEVRWFDIDAALEVAASLFDVEALQNYRRWRESQ